MARNVNISGGAGGGVGSDELTSLLSDVVKGKTAVTSDSNDDPGVGTLELTGNAVAAHVLTGESFYTTDPKNKIVGTMTVNSILSFSVAPYSGRRVLVKWQNPYSVPGKPFGGVIVKCMTGRYPAWDEPSGNIAASYAGVGSNTAPGGWSQVLMDTPNLNTTYYFICFGYARTSFGEIYSPVYDPASVKQAAVATGGVQNVTITGTRNYTIPEGYTLLDVFCVGGGQGGDSTRYRLTSGNGGAGGYASNRYNIAVSAGQVLNCIVGAGGGGAPGNTTSGSAVGYAGAESAVHRGSEKLASAAGGNNGNGGSGGGQNSDPYKPPYHNSPWSNGGQDGGNGYVGTGVSSTRKGQGSTTRAFGNGTLYSGGGGAGGLTENRGGSSSEGYYQWGHAAGSGGSGGGASGGMSYQNGNSAGANTGGGGGGSGASLASKLWASDMKQGGNGGSGIILLRLH